MSSYLFTCPACASEFDGTKAEMQRKEKSVDAALAQMRKSSAGSDALTLLHRGLESGIFEDAPQFKADVQALLASENGQR